MSHSNRASGLFRMGLLASASAGALLAATPALAQPADQPPAPPVDQNAPPATTVATPPPATSVGTEGDTAVTRNPNEIVVTGTRIRSPEFTSPDPVSRIDPTTAMREGKQSLGETLQSSPIAAGSTQITAAISSNFVTNGGPGAQTIDLRGLGANRTLVLLNGRRAGPAGTGP
jgi:iron complex outermembrane receptor protein